MNIRNSLAVSGLALSAFLIAAPAAFAQDHTDAAGMPTDHSTPAEHAQTEQLNSQAATTATSNMQADAQANTQYQQQQQQYNSQLQQNQAAQQQYQNQTASYENLRGRYAAERAAYHRDVWPDRYTHWTLEENDGNLVGQRVEIITGARVGTVTDVAHSSSGMVEGLRVSLDNDKVVWIDQADVRYDRADGIVMTNLDRTDLRQMADERM